MSATAETPSETTAHEQYVERARNRDEPTRTKSLRRDYAQRLRGRWQAIRTAIREGLAENDALGRTEALVDAPTEGQFDFPTDAAQADAFEQWLARQTDREILQTFGGENQYIHRAYERGVEDAHVELRTLGLAEGEVGATALQLPVHRDQLQALFARNLNELEGMTDAVATELRRELAEGLAAGRGPQGIARDLTDVIGQVEDGTPRGAMNRATRIARTEVMHSHNRARATEWERAGIRQVDILIAATACPECQALKAGAPYPVAEAKALIPGSTHPNCRCALTIYTGS
jgi:SPP1 gp7 family putative phage head morphogenesis protein